MAINTLLARPTISIVETYRALIVLVFACLTLVSVVVVYFMDPETKTKSLEELTALVWRPGHGTSNGYDSVVDGQDAYEHRERHDG